jgi:hypothetical protein
VSNTETDIGQAVLDALDSEIDSQGAMIPQPEEEVVSAGVETPEPPAEEEAEVEGPAEEQEEEEGEGAEEETAEEEDTEGQGELESEPVSLTLSTANPEVLALLARYENDVERALRGQIELERALSRQGRDKHQLGLRVQELEGQLAETQMFSDQPTFLTEEQQSWVEEAVGSGQPNMYIRQAVQVGEFDLARAIVEQWSSESPYPALRAGQMIDAAEQHYAAMHAPQETFDHSELLQILAEHYPELPRYEQQMVQTISALGEAHPLVVAARAGTPEEAARGIIGLYEIARAKTATVETTKANVKRKQKEEGVAARKNAVVSSSQSSPASTQAPRPVQIAPGLTWEQYMEELDK